MSEDIDYPLPEQSKSENNVQQSTSEGDDKFIDENDPILQAEKQQIKPRKKIDTRELKADEDEDKTDLSKLGQMAPFSDIAVIQIRYLPKTSRFELFPNLGIMVNNPFFMNFDAGARLAYGISEKIAIEANFMYIMSTKQKVTTDLLAPPHSVQTSSFITAQTFYGADLKWSPVYGKMGFFNKSIIPFDMYFSGGVGITGTTQNTSPFTFHLGTGQIFALSKKMAFRWDVSGYFYNSTTFTASGQQTQSSFTDLYVNLGMSFFFPEATYR